MRKAHRLFSSSHLSLAPLLCSVLGQNDVEGAKAAIKVFEQPYLAPLVSPGLRARALLLLAEALWNEASQPPPAAASEASAPLLQAFLATLQAIINCCGADILQQVGLTQGAEQGSFAPRQGSLLEPWHGAWGSASSGPAADH